MLETIQAKTRFKHCMKPTWSYRFCSCQITWHKGLQRKVDLMFIWRPTFFTRMNCRFPLSSACAAAALFFRYLSRSLCGPVVCETQTVGMHLCGHASACFCSVGSGWSLDRGAAEQGHIGEKAGLRCHLLVAATRGQE